jgi:hypothetical protein
MTKSSLAEEGWMRVLPLLDTPLSLQKNIDELERYEGMFNVLAAEFE